MKRWPIIRHIRYVWHSWRFFRRRPSIKDMSDHELARVDLELNHLDDVWEGRA